MAEVVSILGSIVGLAASGLQIARILSEIADDLNTAGEQIRGVSTDTRAISFSLRELHRKFENDKNVSDDARELATVIVEQSTVDIGALQGFIKNLQPIRGRNLSFGQKIKWLLAKGKIASRRQSLDSLKATLVLFLHTWESIQSGQIDEFTKDAVDDFIEATKSTRRRFFAAAAEEYLAEQSFQISRATTNVGALRIEPSKVDKDVDQEIDDGSETDSSMQETLADTHISRYRSEDEQLQLYDPGALVAESISVDHFLHIADHVRMQTHATKYALAVVESRHHAQQSFPVARPSLSTSTKLDDETPQTDNDGARTEAEVESTDSMPQPMRRPVDFVSQAPWRNLQFNQRKDGSTFVDSSSNPFKDGRTIKEKTVIRKKLRVEGVGDDAIQFCFNSASENGRWRTLVVGWTTNRKVALIVPPQPMHKVIIKLARTCDSLNQADLAYIEQGRFVLHTPTNEIVYPHYWPQCYQEGMRLVLSLGQPDFAWGTEQGSWCDLRTDFVQRGTIRACTVADVELAHWTKQDIGVFSRQKEVEVSDRQKEVEVFERQEKAAYGVEISVADDAAPATSKGRTWKMFKSRRSSER